jgi:polysaccharide biosynthesis protein PelC
MERSLILMLALTLLVSCSPGLTTSRRSEQPLPAGSTLAVMPFENLSGRENASEKITEYFNLSLGGHETIKTIEFGQLYEQMRRFRIRSATLLTGDQIDSLSSALGLNYIITGTVLEYVETTNNYLGSVPQVSLNVRLIDCASGKTVWTGVANARGDQSETVFGIGAVRSLDALAHSVVSQAVDQIASLFGAK